jgi:hypothetical protein
VNERYEFISPRPLHEQTSICSFRCDTFLAGMSQDTVVWIIQTVYYSTAVKYNNGNKKFARNAQSNIVDGNISHIHPSPQPITISYNHPEHTIKVSATFALD